MTSIPSTVDTPRTSSQPRTWMPSLGRLSRNVSFVAIPAIALVVLANLPVAEATPFTDCMDNCDRTATHPLPKLICQALCMFLDNG